MARTRRAATLTLAAWKLGKVLAPYTVLTSAWVVYVHACVTPKWAD